MRSWRTYASAIGKTAAKIDTVASARTTVNSVHTVSDAINAGNNVARAVGRSMSDVPGALLSPITAPPQMIGAAGRAVADNVPAIGKAAASIRGANKMPLGVGAVMGAGAVLGAATSARGTMQDINTAAGNPIGFSSNIGIKTAFAGNPNGSRTQRGNASGNITINSRR